MDPLKEAFQKIKEDILSLKNDFHSMNNEIQQIKTSIQETKNSIEDIQVQTIRETPQNINNIPYSDTQTDIQTAKQEDSTSFNTYTETTQTDIPSQEACQTNNQTDNNEFVPKKTPVQSLYPPKSTFSIGNEGVQTDKPTDKPTDSHPVFQTKKTEMSNLPSLHSTISEFEKVNEILSSLDDVKKEIRHKFKSLTPQEMLIFSTLYTLEDQRIEEIGYQILAKSLSLTESSIRDYINKLIKKGIPIDKTRLNNKKIILKVSENLKKIATLATILKLRDI